MTIIYILERNGQRYRTTDKMAAAQLMLRHGYQLVSQSIELKRGIR